MSVEQMRWPSDPVVVLGNGPVGQTAALLLARWGVPTILLDERQERDLVGSKAICQQRDALDVWQSLGVPIAAEGVTWTTARTFYRREELFALTLNDPGRSSLPPFVNVSQSHTEQLLDEAIAARPLIDVRRGHRGDTITQDTEQVTVTGPGFQLRTPYLLCCTGARSGALRAQLGVELAGHSFDDRFLICDIRATLPDWATERRFYFDPDWNPGRQVLIHACPDSTYRIDWQVPPDYDLDTEVASGALDRKIRMIVGGQPYEVVWKTVYRFHTRCVARMRIGRVLLAGDAAHLFSPFGARGLNSGVADAENAAWKIAFAGRGLGGEELLESYHAERHAAARENVAVTSATMDFLVPRSPAAADHRRDVLTRARTDPDAHPLVDSGRLAEPFWYVDSPLTTPDPSRPFAGRPPRNTAVPPAPGVLLPDLPLTGGRSLRQLCREGLLVLAAPGAPVIPGLPSCGVPTRLMPMTTVNADLPALLDARDGEWWVIRPDAHIAAVIHSKAGTTALRQALDHATGTAAPARRWPPVEQ